MAGAPSARRPGALHFAGLVLGGLLISAAAMVGCDEDPPPLEPDAGGGGAPGDAAVEGESPVDVAAEPDLLDVSEASDDAEPQDLPDLPDAPDLPDSPDLAEAPDVQDSGGDVGDAPAEALVEDLNGCSLATAQDSTTQTAITIVFGGGVGLAYSPPCVKVKIGAQVTFQGAFTMHPLRSGMVINGAAYADPVGPFNESVGTSKTYTLTAPGNYPYYCNAHYSVGMMGVVYVVSP